MRVAAYHGAVFKLSTCEPEASWNGFGSKDSSANYSTFGVIPGARCPMALEVGTPEVQHTISFEPTFGPLSLDSSLSQ